MSETSQMPVNGSYTTSIFNGHSHQQLQKAATILKQEFIGLDDVIDRLSDTISAWYMAPEWQLRPRVINIWGMTGTGKSSLIQRFLELLHLDDQSCSISMALEEPFTALKDWLNQYSSTQGSNKPPVIVLDEFQMAGHDLDFAPMSDERAEEIGELFQWMDTGVWEKDTRQPPSREALERDYAKYKACLEAGVRTQKGYVKEGMEHFTRIHGKDYDSNIMTFDYKDENSSEMVMMPWLVDGALLELICYHERCFSLQDRRKVIERMERMSDQAVHDWIKELIANADLGKRPATDALVFVIGNLDNAFSAGRFDEDSSPDLLHNHSLQVSVSGIQKNLLYLFRKEWVARLGSEHLIFPSLNETQLREYIKREVDKVYERVEAKSELQLQLHPSVADIIYEEGVQASMGIRMLQQSIQNVLVAQIPRILWWARENGETGSINLSYNNGQFQIKAGGTQSILEIPLYLPRRTARRRFTRNDRSCIAVHECGHALLYILLTGKYPINISCASLTETKGGVVHLVEKAMKVVTVEQHKNMMAVLYGGMVAEEIVFGKEMRTTGSERDIELVTAMANSHVQMMGLGSFDHALISSVRADRQEIQSLKYGKRKADKETLELLLEAKARAFELLNRHQEALKKFARELVERKTMKEGEVKELLTNSIHFESYTNQNVNQFEITLFS